MARNAAECSAPDWPAPWAKWRRRITWLIPIGLPLFGGCLFVIAATSPQTFIAYLPIGLTFVIGVGPLAIVRVVNTHRTKRTRSTIRQIAPTGELGTFVPYPRLVIGLLHFAFAAVGAMFASLAILAPSVNTNGMTSRSTAFWNLMGWAGWPLAVACLVLLASYPIRQFRPMGVGMTETGVIVCGWLVCAHWPWDTIDTIQAEMRWQAPVIRLGGTDRHATADAHPAENWLAGIGEFRRTATEIGVQHLAVDPAVVLAALCYYRGHPEARHELGTQASVDRIARLDFGDRPARELDTSAPSVDNPSPK